MAWEGWDSAGTWFNKRKGSKEDRRERLSLNFWNNKLSIYNKVDPVSTFCLESMFSFLALATLGCCVPAESCDGPVQSVFSASFFSFLHRGWA